jgi:hypothetical protein
MPISNGFDALRRRLAGSVVEPGAPEWDVARRAWNLTDQRPAAVALAVGADDVAAVMSFAHAQGLRVAPQATGHGAGALPPLDDTVLLSTAAMRGVAVRPDARVARVEAGALAGDVADATGAHGLAPVAGLASTVGLAGLALGGGVGWLSRLYGLAGNNVRAIELVTAAGERERVDAERESELFWALRGGCGNFAVVTALEVELHPVAEVFAGMLVWPVERAREVLERYRRCCLAAPEELTTVFRYLSLPDIPAVPAPLRGRRTVATIAVYVGDQRDGIRVLDTLRSPGDAELDTFQMLPAAQLVRVAGDPEGPAPARGDGFMVGDLTDDLLAALAGRMLDDALAPLEVLELRHLGGALARVPEGHGVLARLAGAFSVFATGMRGDLDEGRELERRLRELRELLTPWTTAQELLNFCEAPRDATGAFDDETWRRLQRVGERLDPARLVVAKHPVPPASGP